MKGQDAFCDRCERRVPGAQCVPRRPLASAAEGDEARRELIGNFYRNIIAFLYVHHHGEEELVFPLLHQRCPKTWHSSM
jgi:hypothetical protein